MSPENPIQISLMFDEAMAGPVSACLYSIDIAHKNDSVRVYLVYSGFSDENYNKLKSFADSLSIDVHMIEANDKEFVEIASNLPRAHQSPAALYRCGVTRFLPESCRRILYLDCDTLVFSSLRTLYEIDLGGLVAATYRSPWGHTHLAHHGVDPKLYFNSGVMLIDLDKWVEFDIEKEVFSALRTYPDDMLFMDQCALNIVLSHRTKTIPRKYNYNFDNNFLEGDFEFPVIAHFAGKRKPWNNPVQAPLGSFYVEFSKRTPWPVEYVAPPKARKKKTLTGRLKKKIKKFTQ